MKWTFLRLGDILAEIARNADDDQQNRTRSLTEVTLSGVRTRANLITETGKEASRFQLLQTFIKCDTSSRCKGV